MVNMKKRFLIICTFCIYFLLSSWVNASLFDDIFNPNKTFVVPEVSIDVKKPTSIWYQNLKLIEAQFEKIKKKLERFGPSKKKEIYNQASKNITTLVKTRTDKIEKDALNYLNTLVKKEINSLNNSEATLNELFGIKENECIEWYVYKNNDCIKDNSSSNSSSSNSSTQSNRKTCSVSNGYWYQYWDGYSWGNCNIIQCNEWYYISNNSCIRNNSWNNNCYNSYCDSSYQTRYCAISNGRWVQTWNGSYWGSCYAESCNSGYYLSWGSCIKEYLYCWENQHYESGSCISNTRSCSVSNWYGRQTWNGSYWGSCYAESCNSGYYLSWGSCVRNNYSDSCSSNQHWENWYCVSNTRSCSVSNWYGRQTWNGSYWGSCYAESCNSGYYLSWGSCVRNNYSDSCSSNQHWENWYCVSNTRSCSVSNWYGRQTWNGSYWGSCYAESCNSGYYLSWNSCVRNNYSDSCSSNQHYENWQCISNTRTCNIANWIWKETWLGNYWWMCYLQSCNSGYYIFANACVSY